MFFLNSFRDDAFRKLNCTRLKLLRSRLQLFRLISTKKTASILDARVALSENDGISFTTHLPHNDTQVRPLKFEEVIRKGKKIGREES